jgi:hypothetical protein
MKAVSIFSTASAFVVFLSVFTLAAPIHVPEHELIERTARMVGSTPVDGNSLGERSASDEWKAPEKPKGSTDTDDWNDPTSPPNEGNDDWNDPTNPENSSDDWNTPGADPEENGNANGNDDWNAPSIPEEGNDDWNEPTGSEGSASDDWNSPGAKKRSVCPLGECDLPPKLVKRPSSGCNYLACRLPTKPEK